MQNNNFLTISQLRIHEGELKCVPKGKRSPRIVHFRQGDLDGACGVYSIAICLSILGAFNPDDMLKDDLSDLEAEDRKLISVLNSFGLYREGLNVDEIVRILNKNLPSRVHATPSSGKELDLVNILIENIENDVPTIVNICPPRAASGHWIVIVGYQYNEDDVITRFLCLDPGFASPRLALWNGMLDWNSEKKKHTYHNPELSYEVKLESAITIERSKKK